ncbi:hypothetical protein HXX76_004816 [Chlamydomonas incerta]|uniref:RWP-RK domain-containing protein n=1 Tax=Chlamydomonas incerta TaxID=51695 RepID=A0A835TJA2_CHLIN|nr:hypothetical protein HXX76_004816 [Chlamydomonas incerta]|eukprot:KAG2439461.1 hypothetical protein HXX76_004816 [Chlamydomonas incerta]
MELMRQQQVAAAAAVAAAAGAAPKGSPLEGSKDSAEGADLGPDHGFGGGQTRALTKKELATGLHLVLGEGMSEFLAMGVHPTLFAEYLEQIKAASWAMWSGPGLPPANMLRQRMHVALTSPLAIRLLQLDINAGLASKGVRAGPAGLLQGLPLQVPPGMMPMQMAGLGGVDPMLLGSPQHNVAAAMAAAAAAAAAAGGNWPGAGGVPGMLPFPPFGPMATAQMGGGMVDPAMLAAAAAAQQPGAAELEQILLRQQQLQQAKQESHDEQHQQHQQQHQQQHRKQQQTPHGGEAALRRKASSGSGRAGGAGGGSRVRGVSVATAAAADALMGQDVPAASPAERDGDAAVLGRWPSRGSGRQQGDAHARGGAAAGAEVAGPAGKGSGGGAAAAAATAAGAAAAAALGLSRLEALMAATEHVAGLGGEEEGAPESDLGAAAARGEPAGVREAGVPKAGPGGADDPLECEEDFFNAAAAAAAAAAMGGGAAAAATVGVKRRRGASAGAAGAGIADPGAAGTKGLAAAAATAAAMALDRTALLLKAASAAAAADPELRAGGELAGGAMGPHADGAGAGDDDDDDGDDDGDDDPWLGPPGAAGAGAGAGAAGQRSSKARRALAGGRTGSGSVGVGGAAAAQLLLGGALGALGGHGHSVGVGRDGRVLPDGAYTAAAALRRGGGGDDDASMGDGDEDAEYMMGGSGGGMGGGGGGRGRSPATGGDRGGRGWPSGKVGRDDLKQYYHLQAREAAKLLGMALSCFKKVCRRLGVPRWPARKLVCLQRMASTLRTMTNMSAPEKQEALRRVRQNIEDILEDPETAVYEDIRKLLHGQYKMRTNQRQVRGKSGRISGGGGGGGGGGGSGSGGGRPRPSGAGGGLSGDGDDWDDEDDGEDMMLMAPGAMD